MKFRCAIPSLVIFVSQKSRQNYLDFSNLMSLSWTALMSLFHLTSNYMLKLDKVNEERHKTINQRDLSTAYFKTYHDKS